MVLKLGSIEPQGFGESNSGDLNNKGKINKIHDTHHIFATTKGSMNECMELVGFSTSNQVKNHLSNGTNGPQKLTGYQPLRMIDSKTLLN